MFGHLCHGFCTDWSLETSCQTSFGGKPLHSSSRGVIEWFWWSDDINLNLWGFERNTMLAFVETHTSSESEKFTESSLPFLKNSAWILSIHLSLWCLILFRFYQNHHMGFVIHVSSFKTVAPGWGFMTDSTMTSVPTSSEESTTEPE